MNHKEMSSIFECLYPFLNIHFETRDSAFFFPPQFHFTAQTLLQDLLITHRNPCYGCITDLSNLHTHT